MLYTALESAINRNASVEEVAAMLREPLREVAAGHAVQRAVRHPLGFTSLYLEVVGNRGVCLHDWPEDPPPGAPPSSHPDCGSEDHMHSFDLTSMKVAGEGVLAGYEYGVRRTRHPWQATHRLLNATVFNGADHLADAGYAQVVSQSEPSFYDLGDSYHLPRGRFHSSTWFGGRLVTVVLAENDPSAPNHVLDSLAHPPLQASTVQRRPLSPSQTQAMGREMLTLLDCNNAVNRRL